MPEERFSSGSFDLAACASLLTLLVEIDTCQPDGNEAHLVDFIEARYPNTRAICTRIDHSPARASLVVKVPGSKPSGALALAGHLDTVACGDASAWLSPPLTASIKGDTLGARGAADMKGGLAAMLLALDNLLNEPDTPRREVLFCFTADEEKDGLGARALIQSGLLADVSELIICEPSGACIGLAEKGALWVRINATGSACHASRPELGANALDGLLAFVEKSRTILDNMQSHPLLGQNTQCVTNLHGGIMTNIVPASAFLELDIRTLPVTSHVEIVEKLENICAEIEKEMAPLALDLEVLNDRPALGMDESHPLVRAVQTCAQKCGLPLGKKGLFFYTDASQFVPALNVPFVILGPGDDSQAHKSDESISLASVAHFAQIYAALITDTCL